jgi:hypothetical protein
MVEKTEMATREIGVLGMSVAISCRGGVIRLNYPLNQRLF